MALAGLAVVFPTDRTLPALTARLHTIMNQHPQGTDIGDYVRFILVLAAQDDSQTLAVIEKLTDAYWTGTGSPPPRPDAGQGRSRTHPPSTRTRTRTRTRRAVTRRRRC
ncbi:hypothetical protein EAO77_34585 [Streptomyces sp. t39]|nr:hypothetical protein EAO77_34585 [Streptomyces sp. t39]